MEWIVRALVRTFRGTVPRPAAAVIHMRGLRATDPLSTDTRLPWVDEARR